MSDKLVNQAGISGAHLMSEEKQSLVLSTLIGPVITAAAPPLQGDYVFKDNSTGVVLLQITPKQFIFKGEVIEDAGRAYEAFTEVMNQQRGSAGRGAFTRID